MKYRCFVVINPATVLLTISIRMKRCIVLVAYAGEKTAMGNICIRSTRLQQNYLALKIVIDCTHLFVSGLDELSKRCEDIIYFRDIVSDGVTGEGIEVDDAGGPGYAKSAAGKYVFFRASLT